MLVGYLGYPMIQYMEKINLSNPDTLNIPEAVMIRPKIVAVFDNIKDTIDVMTAIYPEKNIKAETALKEAEKNYFTEADGSDYKYYEAVRLRYTELGTQHIFKYNSELFIRSNNSCIHLYSLVSLTLIFFGSLYFQ